jgi:hypothetical protein
MDPGSDKNALNLIPFIRNKLQKSARILPRTNGPLSKLGFVDFRDYFGLFSIVFAGVIYGVYYPRENNRKVGSKEPENRRT